MEVPAKGKHATERLEVCTVCQFVWFDFSEYEALPGIPKKPAMENMLPPEAREKLALLEIDAIREKAMDSDWGENSPDAWWQWIPSLLGMPVECDAATTRSLPWATWGLAALITAVSVISFFDLQSAIKSLGLVPAYLWRYGGLTFLTSSFLHGGVFHLLGNMYFFLVFGDNVEDWLGKWRFILLFVCSVLAGNIAHILGNPDSIIPCIGASGGISGIMAYYALKFPKAKIGFMMRAYFMVRWIRMSACWMFLIWMVMQFFGIWAQLSGFSNVSALAHLGGAATGFVFWFLTRRG